jgi:hypothetical protein
MDDLERRIAAIAVVAELPPVKEDALAVLDEARRFVVDYVFGERLPLEGNNFASRSPS